MSLLALGVSGWAAWDTYDNRVRISRPMLVVQHPPRNGDGKSVHLTFSVRNVGLGPARITSISVVPNNDLSTVFFKQTLWLDFTHEKTDAALAKWVAEIQDEMRRRAAPKYLAVNDRFEVGSYFHGAKIGNLSEEASLMLLVWTNQLVDIEVKYCSIYDECFVACALRSECGGNEPYAYSFYPVLREVMRARGIKMPWEREPAKQP